MVELEELVEGSEVPMAQLRQGTEFTLESRHRVGIGSRQRFQGNGAVPVGIKGFVYDTEGSSPEQLLNVKSFFDTE